MERLRQQVVAGGNGFGLFLRLLPVSWLRLIARGVQKYDPAANHAFARV
jgi:hypothetical protein